MGSRTPCERHRRSRIGPWLWLCGILSLAVCGPARPAQAQSVTVQALVDETVVGAEETLQYSIEVEGASFSEVETPAAPATAGLVLVQPVPSTQRNITFVNGELRQSVAFRWTYRPLRQGEARFLPAEVRVKGEVYETEEIRVRVVAGSQRAPTAGRATPPSGGQRVPEAAAEPGLAVEDLFIRAVPSTNRVYQNEQVRIEYQLFFRDRVQPRHSRLADSWDAEGFWKEELKVESHPIPRTTTENGLRYNTIVLKRVAAFPTRAGSLRVDPLRIETEVFLPPRAGDSFDRLFSMRSVYEPVKLSSPPVVVEAQPLPEDAPPAFQGAVGQYALAAEVGRADAEVGESVQVQVQVSGTGNLATLEAPVLELPESFEPYDPRVDVDIDRSGDQVRGTKTFTYMLVPQAPGTFDLPPVTFSYFDPEAARYRTLQASLPAIQVTRTAAPEPPARVTRSGLPVDDLAGPMARAERWVPLERTPLYRHFWVYPALLLPLLLVGLLYAYRRRVARRAVQPGYTRGRQAHPVARQHLRRAEALLAAEAPRLFYEEVERAVLGFIGNRLDLAEHGLTRDQLDAHLAHAGVARAERQELRALLDECDQMRFAPVRPGRVQMDAALARAHRLITALDAPLDRPSPVQPTLQP